MTFNIQPNNLKSELIFLRPLQENDFDKLFEIASDPLLWEQHPNKYRYKKEEFTTYFKGAILSKGAFIIIDSKTNETVGCSRYYDYNDDENTILIGYTFIGRKYWGRGYNASLKKIMLNYIFQYVSSVYFHIGNQNFRSQKAIEKFGAQKVGEQEVEYYGEIPKMNYIYKINKI
jgi:RimJ/RimL family protein N-acetyltransferase